ncbi:hypothetical protein [Rhizobium mesoamericanum]|uniref:hypothetical protein n=1 Tax=Rhizobium mesoamericanum TaxID=1079800 RepID=UPI0004009C7C|nr:hypothetical protein [Rhizobium mesoamericanum]
MAISRKQAERLLTVDEWQLVQKTHHPAVQDLSDSDLLDLAKRVRERRDRAQSEAHRQRREIRGKAQPKGATPVRKDTGTRAKLEVLAMGVRSVNAEQARRRRMLAKVRMVGNLRGALARKKEAKGEKDEAFNTRQAHAGMHSIESSKRKTLIRPMERGRLRKAGAVSQAKRDSRGA